MRVLVVHPGPDFSVADVHRGWVRGLRTAGAQVIDFNLGDRLGFYSSAGRQHEETNEFVRLVDEPGACRLASKGIEAACFEFLPDVVIIISCFYVPLDILDLVRARGAKVVLVHTESPYEDDRQRLRAEHADINIVNDPTNIESFPIGTRWMPHAYDPAIHHPRPAEKKLASDFCFVGTGYASRIAFLEAVDWAGVDIVLGGNWQALEDESPLRGYMAHGIAECLDNTEAMKLCTSAKASANIYRRESERPSLSEGWAMGPREVELAASGVFFLRESRGEGDGLLHMLPTFDGPADFAEKLRWWLAHPDQRQSASASAREAVAGRTFEANASQLLRLVEASTN